MMKMKKLASLVLAMVMCLTLCVPAMALDAQVPLTIDLEEEIARAKSGITDLETNSDINSASITAFDKAGVETTSPVEVYTTTRKLSSLDARSIDGAKIYATTSVATYTLSSDTSDTNSENDYFVTAYGTLYWRDNMGTGNEFLSASGGWNADTNPSLGRKPTLSNRSVQMFGQGNAQDKVNKTFNYSANSFTVAQSQFSYKRFSFWFDSTITVEGSNILLLRVGTSF